MLNKRRFLATRIIYHVFIHCVGINLPLFFLVLQPAVLFLRQAALFRSGQCWSPASGLPAHAGALRHISGDRHAHWDVCPGDYHTRAPCQRLVLHVAHRACRYFLTKQQKRGPTMSGTVFVAIDFGRWGYCTPCLPPKTSWRLHSLGTHRWSLRCSAASARLGYQYMKQLSMWCRVWLKSTAQLTSDLRSRTSLTLGWNAALLGACFVFLDISRTCWLAGLAG